MLCVSIGLPGRFATWCDAAITQLAGFAGGRTEYRQLPTTAAMLGHQPIPPALDEISRLLIGTDARSLVVGVRQPDCALLLALGQSRARVVVPLDNPRIAAAELLEETGANMRLITRAVANSYGLLTHYGLPGGFAVIGDAARADPVRTVAAVARHLGVATQLGTAGRIVAELAASGNGLAPAADWADRIPEAARKTLDGAISAYEERIAGRGFGRIVWSRDLFIACDTGRPPAGLLDLAGGARVLLHGPFIHLPPGVWNAQVYLGLSPEAAGTTLLIEAHAGDRLAGATLQPGSGGVFATDLDFAVAESAPPVEIRVMLGQDGAGGRLAFGRVEVQPAEAARRSEAIGEWDEIESLLDL